MAEKQAGGLAIRIGLTLGQLQSDFLTAEQTIKQGLSNLNRQQNIVKLRMETDLAGLDAATDKAKILEIQEKSLTQILTMQRDRLTLATQAYQEYANGKSVNAVVSQRLETAMERERLTVARLEAELKSLANQKTPSASGLLGSYQGLKENISGTIGELSSAFSSLTSATSSADAALTAALTTIGSMPTPIGKTVAALASLPVIFLGIENSVVDLIKATASAGDATYVMSRGFQMSIADTGKFTAMCKTAGVEVNDLASTIKRTQQQIIRGGEHAKTETWLKRYGETAFDANGHLKNLNEMTLTLSRALKRAQAEGNGMAFILGTMRGASADAITAIEDAEDVYKQASHLVKNGLANPALAHEVQGNINAMNLQASFMHATFKSALLPVANEIIPRMTERMGKFTSLIKDNKDVILDFGRDLAQVWSAVENGVDKVVDGFTILAKLARDNRVVRQTTTDDILEKYAKDSSVKTVKDLLEKEIANGGYTAEDKAKLVSRTDLSRKELQRTEQDLKALYEKRREDFVKENKLAPILNRYKSDDSIKTMTDLLNRLTAEEKDLIKNSPSDFFGSIQEKVGVLNLELQKLKATIEETTVKLKELLGKELRFADVSGIGQERQQLESNEDLIEKLRDTRRGIEDAEETVYKLTHTDYQNKIFDLQKWLQEKLPRDTEQSLEKYQAVMKAYSAKLDQINKEHADAIAVYWKNAAEIGYEMTHTAFEKELRDIDEWKDAQLKKAEVAEETSAIIAEAAAKEARAFEREVDRIKGQVQSLEDKIYAQEHSQYENDLRKLQQERMRLYEEGSNTPEMIERYYQNAVADLKKKAAEGGDYTKKPDSGLKRGGNGIVVIGGDTVLDDGLTQAQTKNIDLLVDENKIRERLLPNLTESGREFVAAQQAAKKLTEAQSLITQSAEKAASGFQLIEGDQVVNMPELPTETVQEFNSALQQTTTELELANPADAIASAENQMTEQLNQALPINYFQNVADGMDNVSNMQLRLVDSTMKLIDAQGEYMTALSNIPKGETSNKESGYQHLSYSNQNTLEPLPTQRQDSGWKFGFDQDTAGLLSGLASLALMGTGAVSPALLGGAAALSLLGGAVKGSIDATTAPQGSLFGGTDLAAVITPLTNIDTKIDTIVTPLNTIQGVVEQILSALHEQGAKQINVSPQIDIDLGGAYVFDNAMKLKLTEDITNTIVTEITSTVEKATSQRSYGFSV